MVAGTHIPGRTYRLPENSPKHLTHLKRLLTLPKVDVVALNQRKWLFFAEFISYLGHVICPMTIGNGGNNSESIKKAGIPDKENKNVILLGSLQKIWRTRAKRFANCSAIEQKTPERPMEGVSPIKNTRKEVYRQLKKNISKLASTRTLP